MLQARAIAEYSQLHIGQQVRGVDGHLRTFDLYGTEHRGLFVNDVALPCHEQGKQPSQCEGPIYPAKPPGASLLGVPALFLATSLGIVNDGVAGEPMATWIVRYLGSVPFALLGLWLLMLGLRNHGVPESTTATILVATGLGSGVLPYGLIAVGHAIAGTALLGGVMLLQHRKFLLAGIATAAAL